MSAARYLAFAAAAALAALWPRAVSAAGWSAADEAAILEWGAASGGDEIRYIDNGDGSRDFIHIFNDTSSIHTLYNPLPREALILAVGGGGSGGSDCGGGGGAGGVVTNSLSLSSGAYSIKIGEGGAYRVHNTDKASDGSEAAYVGYQGQNGGATSITNSFTGAEICLAYGGGGGGSYVGGNGSAVSQGLIGGSGGGSSGDTGDTYRAPGAAQQAAPGLGNAGSKGYGNNIGGGGGGALSEGGSATASIGGAGGSGITLDITGEEVVYARGGGGGSADNNIAYGGGDDTTTESNGGNSSLDGQPGAAGTGSGGGGGGRSPHRRSGSGGSGIVVVRYRITPEDKPQRVAGSDTAFYYRFTNSAPFVVTGAMKARILAVGGGGAGASPAGNSTSRGGAGGGGAGEVKELGEVILNGGIYNIYVGAGGAAGDEELTTPQDGDDGKPTAITNMTTNAEIIYALGGGGGGVNKNSSGTGNGRLGASGGGGSAYSTSETHAGGAASAGNPGGIGKHTRAGGGGGGAGSAGGDTTGINNGGAGGDGIANNITGDDEVFAAGGGGGSRTGTGGAGGSDGIGGAGGGGSGTSIQIAKPGKDGTGSGGGGGRLNGAGGAGGCGVVIIRVEAITYAPLDKPVDGSLAYATDSTGAAITQAYWEYDEEFFDVTGDTAATNVGEYTFTATPKAGVKWTDQTSDSVTVTWKITAPTLQVVSFSQEGWQVGMARVAPALVTIPQVSEMEGTVIYRYYSGTTLLDGYPTVAGSYRVVAEIQESVNYGLPAENPEAEFELWDYDTTTAFVSTFAYHAKIGISYTGTAVENFPMLVKISENSPAGFHYRDAGEDGGELRFADSDGNLLPHEVDGGWNEDGATYIWVRVPRYADGEHITMNWGALDGVPFEANDPAEVWSSYAGVWHFQETATAATAASVSNEDSTGNGMTAQPRNSSTATTISLAHMVSTNGVFGLGRVNMSYPKIDATGTYLNIDKTKVPNLAGKFTFSGWVKFYDYSGSPRIVSAKEANTQTGAGTWEVELTSARNNVIARANGSESTTARISTQIVKSNDFYTLLTVVYDGTQMRVYGYEPGGVVYATTNTVATGVVAGAPLYALSFGNNARGSERSLQGAYDEFRLRFGAVDEAWIAAEYAQAAIWGGATYAGTETAGFTFGARMTDQGSVLRNRWVVYPVVSPTAWALGDNPSVYEGQPLYGTPYWYFVDDAGTALDLATYPTAPGRYTLVFRADAGGEDTDYTKWGALETLVTCMIKISSPYSSLAGSAGSSTLAGRVLLANDDGDITGQSYYRIDPALYDTYWNIVSTDVVPPALPHMMPAVNAIFTSTNAIDELCGAKEIWELDNVRIGNIYPATIPATLPNNINFLPWSSTSAAFSSAAITELGRQDESAHLLMRNMEGAAVYSPCYTNGIGTIYFDAVNGWTSETGDEYKLVLEVATDVVDVNGDVVEGLLPTDENVHQVMEQSTDPDTGAIIPPTTNRWVFANWTPVEMTVLKSDSKTFEEPYKTKELALAESAGASYANFYRVYAALDITTPARFRIKRISAASGTTDATGLILLDNIEVSYPAMRADIAPTGAGYDTRRGGKQVLGWEAAFEPALPAVGDEIYASGVATYRTNPGNPAADTNNFISAATVHYRWRYAEQVTGDWQEMTLARDTLKAGQPLVLPAGLLGDVEFWYELVLNAPYYSYVDYSGTGLKVGEYTEETSTVTNALNSAATLDTRGTDWFIRLREGVSAYEDIVLETVADGVTNSIPMELTGDGAWRACYQTLPGADGSLQFRLRPVTLAKDDEGEWQRSTNLWYWAEDEIDLPLTGNLIGSDNDETWGELELDDTTGYLLFQLDDSTRALSVVHADYQNFNYWNDAHKSYYSGAYTDSEGSKSGVSALAKAFELDFSGWDSMTATNRLWTEKFQYSSGIEVQETFYQEYPDITTPNGWAVQNGSYVHGRYMDEESGGAMLLAGAGRGLVQYVKASSSPRGVDTVKFSARIGQSISFEDASYWKITTPEDLSGYTFVAKAAYDRNSNQNFRGAATMSLFANYQEDNGAYEFRMVQAGGSEKNGVKDNDKKVQKKIFSLYRWAYDESADAIVPTLLGCTTNDVVKIPETTTASNAAFLPMFISCSNEVEHVTGSTYRTNVWVIAGIGHESGTTSGIYRPAANVTPQSGTATSHTGSGKYYFTMTYRDTSPHELTCGSFGVESANCPGYFMNPGWFSANVPPVNASLSKNTLGLNNSTQINFPGTLNWCRDGTTASASDRSRRWILNKSRMEMFVVGATGTDNWGVKAKDAPVQTLTLYTAPAGTADSWTMVTNCVVSGYGSVSGAASTYTVDMRSLADCSLRLKASGSSQNGIVIDDIDVSQWRGDDYAHEAEMRPLMKSPTWVDPSSIYDQTNFIFYSGWILNHQLLLSARRTLSGSTCGIRSPLFDGEWGRTKGVGMFSFKYENAQANTRLLLQIATNVNYQALSGYDEPSSTKWTTVATYDFSELSDEDRKSGSFGYYFGLHGVNGMMRLIMDPALVDELQNATDGNAFGEVYITDVYCRDEPEIDDSCWTGWNLRSVGDTFDSEKMMYLADVSKQMSGLSLALNNSISADIDPALTEDIYSAHPPYVQTPLFGTNVVGEIAFRARRYDLATAQPAAIALYGSTNPSDESKWKLLETFDVPNDTFTTLYSYKTNPSEAYSAFRLAVTGVDGVADGTAGVEGYAGPVRILIDEIVVSEAIRARIGFRNVGVFRSDLNTTGYIPGLPSRSEQPICGEDWGVQCQIYAAQLGDEIDFARTPQVYLHWYEGEEPWGYENWATNKAAKTARLAYASGTNLVYRSSYINARDAVVPLSLKNTTIQYTLEVVYYQKNHSDPVTNRLSAIDWQTPDWYSPVDYNADYASSGGWSAYNIIDAVPYGWAWINEANVYGQYDSSWQDPDRYNQFVEIAAPQEADLTGWKVQMLAAQLGTKSTVVYTNTVATFGASEGQPSGKKSLNAASNMTFRVIANKYAVEYGDLKKSDGTLDALWDWEIVDGEAFMKSGLVSAIIPVAVQLVRPSKIVEHQVVFMGTNMFNSASNGEDTSYDPTNLVNRLNARMTKADFLWHEQFDEISLATSVGVTNSNGKAAENWTAFGKKTPGRINEGQYINPDHPTPNGTSMIIYSNLSGSNIWQLDANGEFSDEGRVIIIQKGSKSGTNITYRVGPWYELATPVEIAGQGPVTPIAGAGTREYILPAVGAGVSNNVTITASAQPNSILRDYGVDSANRYSDAIINWLNRGTDAFGNKWPATDEDTIYLADFMNLSGSVITNLDLTTMYWLDMCPAIEGLALVGGPNGIPQSVEFSYVNQVTGETVKHDNIRYSFTLYITNRNENAGTQLRGLAAWAPYTLQGSDADTFARVDGDVTFKIMARRNLATDAWDLNSWVPLRYFTFAQNSFDSNFQSTVELLDPAKNEAWYYWDLNHPGQDAMYFQWSIDSRTGPYDVQTLQPENFYSVE